MGQVVYVYLSQVQCVSVDVQVVVGDEVVVVEVVVDMDVVELCCQLEVVEEKVCQNYENWVCVMVEGENICCCGQEDVVKVYKFVIEGFVEYLLFVMDSLQVVLVDILGDVIKLCEGVELMFKQLYVVFEKGCVIELNLVGEKFDLYCY